MAKYPFLSDEWLAEARKIRQEYKAEPPPPAQAIRMNQTILDVPFGSGTLQAHLDTSAGEMEVELGHLEDADLKVTLEYATAKAILVEGNPAAGMQAFMAGKIKVEGDMAKLIALQAAAPDPAAIEVARKIQAITE